MCYDEGTLQAYLDRELSADSQQEIMQHLSVCPKCREAIGGIRDAHAFAESVLGSYARGLDRIGIDKEAAWERLQKAALAGQTALAEPTSIWRRGVLNMISKYRSLAVGTAAVLCLATALSFGSVRSAAADFLTIFRVEKVQTISFNPKDFAQIEEALKEGGLVNLEELGRIEVSGRQDQTKLSLDEARQAADFSLKVPALPAGYNEPVVTKYSPVTVNFTLNVKNINQALISLGAKDLLPADVDGKTFSLSTPMAVSLEYAPAGEGKRRLTVIQSLSPELQVPAGVDVNAIRSGLLSIPMLPNNLRQQLEAVNDWQHTLLLPDVDGSTKEVKVGSASGAFISQPNSDSVLLWQQNGVVTSIVGRLTLQEAQDLAASMR